MRYFDTAPFTVGSADERRMGAVLRHEPRDCSCYRARSDGCAPAATARRAKTGSTRHARRTPVFDYSYDGVMRSVAIAGWASIASLHPRS